MTSCTKDFTCSCTGTQPTYEFDPITGQFIEGTETVTSHYIIPETTKKTAKVLCKANETYLEDNPEYADECELD